MRFGLKTLFVVLLLMSAVFAVWLYRAGEHVVDVLDLPNGTVVEIRADNVPTQLSLWRESLWGRHILFSTQSAVTTATIQPGSTLSLSHGEFCKCHAIPERSYQDLKFQTVSTKDRRYHGVYEKRYPNILLLLYDATTRTITTTDCARVVSYRHCCHIEHVREMGILSALAADNPPDSGAKLQLYRCELDWHHAKENSR